MTNETTEMTFAMNGLSFKFLVVMQMSIKLPVNDDIEVMNIQPTSLPIQPFGFNDNIGNVIHYF